MPVLLNDGETVLFEETRTRTWQTCGLNVRALNPWMAVEPAKLSEGRIEDRDGLWPTPHPGPPPQGGREDNR
jgi:hypothetical protein